MGTIIFGWQKFIRITALTVVIGLCAQMADAQHQSQITRADGEKEAKQMLEDLARDYPVLVGASAKWLDGSSCSIHLKNGRDFTIQTDYSVGSLLDAFVKGLRDNLPKQVPISEATAMKWLGEFTASEPDLKGVTLFRHKEVSNLDGGRVYFLMVGPDLMRMIVIAPWENTKEEFRAKIQAFLRGDTYQKEGRVAEGVTMEIRPGAAKVMGLTRIAFGTGNVYFKSLKGSPYLRITGDKLANQKFVWEKTGERDLRMTITHQDGSSSRYEIENGIPAVQSRESIRSILHTQY